MALSAWLARLGLERFASAFDAAEVDSESLRLLSEEDLKELGLPLGPRRKLLAALAEGVAASDATPDVAPAPERRQLTVLFADLVGSTALSVRNDPEAVTELLQGYKAIATEEVTHGGGMVAKYLGDGVLAYFGWPQAREDAPECAIRCALAIVERVKALRGPIGEPVACRIGVATGLVVVGGVTGSGFAREDTIAGEVLNLAARLEAVAEPNGVVIADATYRLVGQLFDCSDLGEHALKGFDAPVRAWRPIREALHTRRFTAARALRTPLVGREQELAMLGARWEKARQGEGRAVLLLGEAGMGKSRLAEALHSQIVDTPHSLVSWQCSAFHSGKALYPVIDYITAAAGIVDADPPPARLAKLTALLAAATLPLDEALPLFADLLALPPSAGYAPSELLPAQRRAATIAALVDWLAAIAGAKPLLLLLEDAHWADATTLDLLTRLVGAVGRAPILVLVTSRPGFAAPWIGGAQAGVIGLDRLSDAQCETLVRGIAAEAVLSRSVIAAVVEKSDGNPLFLEELGLAVFDPRTRGEGVPDSLQSSLMARLDRLGEAKRVAQTCAVLGRRFATPLLVRVVDLDAATLDAHLAALVEADILYPLGRAQDGRFEFKHALVRDAAYGSLLLSRRRELHARCGHTLEREFADIAAVEPELLAHHFAHAQLPAEASRYAERAGDRAVAAVSFVEAIAGYREALEQSAKTAAGPERDARELALLLKLGPAQIIIDGVQSMPVRDTYTQAEALGRAQDDPRRLFQATWGLWMNANIGRDLDVAAGRAQQLQDLGERLGDDAYQLEALHCRWSSSLFRGDYAATVREAAEGAANYVRERHHVLHVNFGGHDPGVCAHACWCNASAGQGRFAQSHAAHAEGLALAEALEHPHSLCHLLMVGAVAAVISRDRPALELRAGRLLTLASRFNFPPLRALATYLLDWARSEDGSAEGLEAMRSAIDGVSALAPYPLLYGGLLAEQLVARGEYEAALSLSERWLPAIRPAGVGLYLPELHRLRGEALLATGEGEAADAQFAQALAIARGQVSPLLAARALASQLRAGRGADLEAVRTALRHEASLIDAGAEWPDRAAAEALLA